MENTYCRDVYSGGKTIALIEIDGTPGLKKHPLYSILALNAYISTPVFYRGTIIGTVNFSSLGLREDPFSQTEIEFVECLAEKITTELEACLTTA